MADTSSVDILARLLPSMSLIIGALFLLRRWGRRGVAPDSAVRVVGRTGVTRNSVVAIVEVGTQRYLVGAGDSGVNVLAELEPAPDSAAPAIQAQHTDQDEAQRRSVLKLKSSRPWSGLVHRLRQMTVRTHVEAALREDL